jgi:tetratricopeptide (TPR) repeat protein
MRYLYFIIIIFLTIRHGYSQTNSIENLKHSLQNSKNDTSRCDILDQLIEIAADGDWQKYNEQLYAISSSYLTKNITERELILYSRYYVTSLHNRGISYSEQSNDEKAITYFNEAIKQSIKYGLKNEMAISMQAIAQIDIRKGNNAKALNILYNCLKIFEDVKDEIGVADVHLSIGNICFLQRDYQKAIEHHEKSLELYLKNKYDVALNTVYFKLGVDYNSIQNYSKALFYLEKSIHAVENAEYDINSVAYLNIAQIYIFQNKLDDALLNANKSLEIATNTKNVIEISHSHVVLSKIFSIQKKYDKAIFHGNEALKIGQEIKHPTEIAMASGQLYSIYKETNNEKNADKMHQIYIEAKNELDNEESKNALLEQKLKYEYEKKELITKAEIEKKLSAITLENEKNNLTKNIWLVVIASILILSVVSSFFLFRYFKQKSLINEQKNNLLKQKLLVSQMNPHFIFNSLNAIQNYIFKQDSLKAGDYLAQFSELIRMILDYSRKDFISVEAEKKLLTNYLNLQKLRFENKFNYSITIDKQINISEVFIPPMLAQPFIENAIEHGLFHKTDSGSVDVRLFYENDLLTYEIEDDGIGMEEALKLKRKLKSSYESLATVITKERMNSFNTFSKKKIDIEIIDKHKINAQSSGVKVKFLVPIQEI